MVTTSCSMHGSGIMVRAHSVMRFLQIQQSSPESLPPKVPSSPPPCMQPDADAGAEVMPFPSMRLSGSETSGSIFQAPVTQTLRRGSSESLYAPKVQHWQNVALDMHGSVLAWRGLM